ncbi:putative addiction module component (TIGR02574 family) [Flavobacterium sp. PL11]|jgi:putative addiction module component (TIGR02574 family)|uniref:addiction module protein n=1 Tax=Flavobacterium sp. PL11 TaxID=3071717 RepID=UPI002E0BEE63|nr:putative addiction module component (TIGR02574 family) [Flavobacterium sp. PL11]
MEIKDFNKITANEKTFTEEQLWDSFSNRNIDLSSEIKWELDFRLQKVEEGKEDYFTWEDVKKHIESIK